MASGSKQISVAATAIALRGVRLFLTAGKNAAEKSVPDAAQPAPRPKKKPKQPVVGNKLSPKVIEQLLKTTKFNK